MRGSNCSFPATAERIMVVPKAVARTTAPNNQKSKYRHEISRSIISNLPNRYLRSKTNLQASTSRRGSFQRIRTWILLHCTQGTNLHTLNLLGFFRATPRRALDRNICHKPLRTPIVFDANLHGLHVDLDVTADGRDQIISKGIKFGRSQIRAVMDEDQLQALLGAIRTGFLSEQTVKETHFTSSPPDAGFDPKHYPYDPDRGTAPAHLSDAGQCFGRPGLPCSSCHMPRGHHGLN